jgi:hypothetical protein
MEKSEKVSKLEELLKQAFLIDGEVKVIGEMEAVIEDKNAYGNIYKLTDSKRKGFYIIVAVPV